MIQKIKHTKRTRKFLVLLFVSMVYGSAIYSQDHRDMRAPDLNMASPTAAGLGKYAEAPVNYFNGLAQISIPLFTIREGSLELPVSLSYHSSGIRVEDEASNVGLGWSLLAGGVITHEQRAGDDFPNGPAVAPCFTADNAAIYSTSGETYNELLPFMLEGYFVVGSTDLTGWEYDQPKPWDKIAEYLNKYTGLLNYNPGNVYTPIFSYNKDLYYYFKHLNEDNWTNSEPDIFNLTFPEGSCQFVFDRDDVVKTKSVIRVINHPEYDIRVVAGDVAGESGFLLTTPTGNKYYFTAIEYNQDMMTSWSNTGKYYQDWETTNWNFNLYPDMSKYSGWYLKKIVSPTEDCIVFNYTTATKRIKRFSRAISFFNQRLSGNSHAPSDQITSINVRGNQLWDISYTEVNELILNSIDFTHGNITFNTSNRSDLLNAHKIDSITLTGTQIEKKFTFGYVTENDRLVLRNLTESVNGNNLPSYVFGYYGDDDPTGEYKLPPHDSYMIDYWGYYNGKSENEDKNTLIPDLPDNLYDVAEMNGLSPDRNEPTVNREVDTNYTKAGSLKSIRFPIGATEYFYYQGNTHYNNPLPSQRFYNIGGGLRVSAIITKDENNIVQKCKRIEYDMGVLMAAAEYAYNTKFNHENEGTVSLFSRSSNGIYPFSFSAQGSSVGYRLVYVYEGTGNDLHKTEYWYNAVSDESFKGDIAINCIGGSAQFHVSGTPSINFPENGLLTDVFFYKKNGTTGVWSLVKSEIYTYDNTIKYRLVSGMKPVTNYAALYYPIRIYTNKLIRKTVTAEITEHEYYEYENSYGFLRQSRKQLEGSTENVYTRFYYPFDFNNTITSQPEQMQKHIINIPYRVDQLKNTALISSQATQYNTQGLPINFYSYRTSTLAAPPANEPAVFPPMYYDNIGSISYATTYPYNPIAQQSEDGQKSAYIWGYDNKLLVAKIVNATSSDIVYRATESTTSGVGPFTINKSSTKDCYLTFLAKDGVPWVQQSQPIAPLVNKVKADGWRYYKYLITSSQNILVGTDNALINVKDIYIYPTDALITSYTHKPLVGITSETDSRGQTIFYDYDNFGRLQLIKDNDGNVLKKYDYHYGAQ